MTKKLMFIIALLALVALLTVPVSAVDYQGTLTNSIPGTPYTGGNGAANEVSTKHNSYTLVWYTDLNVIGKPSSLTIYTVADQKVVGDTTFTLRDNLGEYANGTVHMGNGTNLYPGATKQFYTFTFSSWDTGSRVGMITSNLTLPVGTNYFPLGVPVLPTAGMPFGLGRNGQVGMPGGYIYIPYDDTVNVGYTINKVDGSGVNTISNIRTTKASGNTLSSNVQVRSADVLIGSSLETSRLGTDDLTVVGNNYKISMYVPLKLKYYNSSVFFPAAASGVSTTSYTLEVLPDTGTIDATYTAGASSSTGVMTQCDAYTIICNSGQVSGSCLFNLSAPVFIKKADTFWYQRTTTSDIKMTTAFPASVPLKFTAPGTYTVEGTFFETAGGGGTAQDTVTVTSTGVTKTFTVNAQDSLSGALVSGAEIQIKTSAGTWSNLTTLTGTRAYSARSGEIIGYGASATGYVPSSILYTQVSGDLERTVTLSKYIPVAVGNNTLYVYARDSRTLTGLDGALIVIGDGQTKTTPASGLSTFTVLEGGTYQITVSKPGFQSLTRTMIVAGSSNAISMELSPIYVTTQRTLAPGETATPAPQATKDSRTNPQKQEAAVKIVYDNAEYIVWGLVALIFIGIIKMALKGWKFW